MCTRQLIAGEVVALISGDIERSIDLSKICLHDILPTHTCMKVCRLEAEYQLRLLLQIGGIADTFRRGEVIGSFDTTIGSSVSVSWNQRISSSRLLCPDGIGPIISLRNR